MIALARLLVLAGLPALHAPAPERPLAEALQVEPGASCLEPTTLLEHLASWRGDDLLDARLAVLVVGSAADPRAIRVEIWVGPELWIERSFEAAPERCADRHAVVALAIAIALDDTLAEELGLIAPLEPDDSGEPNPPAEPEPTEQVHEDELPSDDSATSEALGRRTKLGLTAAAGVFGGVHPQLAAGGSLTFDMRPRPHFDLRVGAMATHAPTLRFLEGSVASTVAAGRVDLCWGTLPRTIRLRLCGGFAGGALVAQARGFARNYDRTYPWMALLAGIDLVIQLVGPLALELRIDGFAALQRNILEIDEASATVGSLGYPAGGLMIGLGPRFEF